MTQSQASREWVVSLNAKRTYIVPDQTALVAHAIFPGGNHVMRLYDDLHMVVADRDFADLNFRSVQTYRVSPHHFHSPSSMTAR